MAGEAIRPNIGASTTGGTGKYLSDSNKSWFHLSIWFVNYRDKLTTTKEIGTTVWNFNFRALQLGECTAYFSGLCPAYLVPSWSCHLCFASLVCDRGACTWLSSVWLLAKYSKSTRICVSEQGTRLFFVMYFLPGLSSVWLAKYSKSTICVSEQGTRLFFVIWTELREKFDKSPGDSCQWRMYVSAGIWIVWTNETCCVWEMDKALELLWTSVRSVIG